MAESTSNWIFIQLLFFLRVIQLGSTVLTGFIAIHFIYWHEIVDHKYPAGLIIVITTSSISFLESYLSSAYALSTHTTQLTHNRLLLLTTTPVSIIMNFGYYSLRQVPGVREWCEGNNWFIPAGKGFRGSDGEVERHMCALTCTIIVSGGIALASTMLLPVLAGVGMLMEGNGGKGQIRLEDDAEYEDDPIAGSELGEKGEMFDEA